MPRPAQETDLDYLVGAGKEFCKAAGYSFDEIGHREMVREIIYDPECLLFVTGTPATGHCACRISPSLFNPSERVGRVFSTWGKGGLKCFLQIREILENIGVEYLMADMLYDKRIGKFYSRQGMRQADTVFIQRLK